MSKDKALKKLKNSAYGFSLEKATTGICVDCDSVCISTEDDYCCNCKNYDISDLCSNCFEGMRATEREAWELEKYFEGSR